MDQVGAPKYTYSHCLLDCDGYISLGKILTIYDAPISEDHAWALCYLSGKYLETHSFSSFQNSPSHVNAFLCKQIPDSELIKIHHHDGHVVLDIDITQQEGYFSKFQSNSSSNDSGDKRSVNITELISKIALVIYNGLDFGMKANEERSLSFQMESILEKMMSSDNTKTNENCTSFSEHDIINACLAHFKSIGFSDDQTADTYYHQTCKTLVLETLEFSTFLNVAERASKQLHYLRGGFSCGDLTRYNMPVEKSFLNTRDELRAIAKLWIQVVQELRSGVTLRRLDESVIRKRHRHEFKKTPYELLMDDIKSQKYKLKKVPEKKVGQGKGKMDVHDIIMEYIRSRPKLRKVSERILRPLARMKSDPYTELMKSIREVEVHHLRHVSHVSKMS